LFVFFEFVSYLVNLRFRASDFELLVSRRLI